MGPYPPVRSVQVKSRETCILYFFSSAGLPQGNASIFCDGAKEGYTTVFYTYVHVYRAVAASGVPSSAGGMHRTYLVFWWLGREKEERKKGWLNTDAF